jgi:hypothetical protein
MGRKAFITDEQRDNVIKMYEAGIVQQDIANIMGFGLTTVNNMINVAMAVKDDNWERYSQLRDSIPSNVIFEWALAKYGKTEPKPAVKLYSGENELEAQAGLPKPTFNIKDEMKAVFAEVVEENCKCNIEQIDKDQMARLMFALGQVTGYLERVVEKLDALLKVWS